MFKKNKLFRTQAVENISSPEKIGLYIKISNPSVIVIILATTFFVIGVAIWSVFYKIDTITPIGATCKNGLTECFLNESDFTKLKKIKNPQVIINQVAYPISQINTTPKRIKETNYSYAMHKNKLKPGDWAFKIVLKTNNLNDGFFTAYLITNKIKPISFVFN